MERSTDGVGTAPRNGVQRWAPAVLVIAVIGGAALGAVAGVRTLLSGPVEELVAAETETLRIEEYEPVAAAPTSTPTHTGTVYASNGSILERPKGAILKTIDGLYQMDISTYTDHQIAQFMVTSAAWHAGLEPIYPQDPMRDGAVGWLREVVTTPVEAGGPDLRHTRKFVEILDRWEEGDFTNAYNDWEWLVRVEG